MTLAELRSRLAYWQQRLGLGEWTIKIRWAKKDELPREEACVHYCFDRLVAEIVVKRLTESGGEMIVPRNVENDVCHECLHLIIDDPVPANRERGIARIARALTGKP